MLPRHPCDVECYRNFFLVQFLDPATGQLKAFPMWPGQPLNIMGLRMALAMCTLITFNGNNYDMFMIAAAVNGADNATLKAYNDEMIVGKVKCWDMYRKYNIPKLWDVDHIDLQEVAPGVRIGLKMYAGRMHSRKMQDLPIDPAQTLSWDDMLSLTTYCGNDLAVTQDLYEACRSRLELREDIGQRFNIDVRSKSDAQIAEAVIKAQLPFKPDIPQLPHGFEFRYTAPPFIGFSTPQLQSLLQMVQTVPFVVYDVDKVKSDPDEKVYDSDGKEIKTGVKLPKQIKGTDIRIGNSVYRMGIGGLHSQESSTWHMTTGEHVISDHDVASYYPSLILRMGMYPAGIGPEFLTIYEQIYMERLHAKNMASATATKKAGDNPESKRWKTIADGLKITLNGTFGKLGSKYSILFAPELMIRTTITGQLALLMLIEALENAGIAVVSANTDGIVLKTPKHLEPWRDEIIKWWEQRTGLETEATFYKAIFSRDVNNYVAFKDDGTSKGKGVLADPGIIENKHPDREICKDAAIAYLGHGTPFAQTIRACRDVRKFLRVRNVKGGGYWTGSGEYLGKSVRWYYGMDRTQSVRYTGSNNKVAESDGAVPMMELRDDFPADIDYAYYEREAADMVRSLGVAC